MRALRVRTRNAPRVMLVFVLASFFFGQSEAAVTFPSFCYLYMAIEVVLAKKMQFSTIFSLFGAISSHIHIEVHL